MKGTAKRDRRDRVEFVRSKKRLRLFPMVKGSDHRNREPQNHSTLDR